MKLTDKIKNYILNDCDMDLVGIAPASALAGEPDGHKPTQLLPGAKSILVFGRCLSDGAVQSMFRKHEDKVMVSVSSYAAYANELAPNFLLVNDTFNISQYLEDTFGVIAMPVTFNVQQGMVWNNVPGLLFADPYGQGMPLNIYNAAVAAGLGEYGWSNRFVTPAYGPRQILSAVITTMELDYDAPYSGEKLCDPEKCGICAKMCPVGAIPCAGCGSKQIGIEGKMFEVADLNVNGCIVAESGYRGEFRALAPVPNLIEGNSPTDEEMKEAFAKKPMDGVSVEHYPRYYCEKCLIYCPLGNWKERFAGYSSAEL